MHFDLSIFTFFNNLARHSIVLDYLGIFLAEYSQYVLGAILLVLLFYPQNKKEDNRSMVVLSLTAAIIARYVVKTGILFLYGRSRPYVVLNTAHKLIPTSIAENFQSFPSGHAIFFFALAAVLYKFDKKLGNWFFGVATIMGIARVFVGVHWPSDIIGGAVLGIIVGWATYFGYKVYKNKINNIIGRVFRKIDTLIGT